MTAEMWTIIGAAIALAAAVLPGLHAIRRDLTTLAGEVGGFRERMGREMGDLRERMARLEGLLEGFTQHRKNARSAK